MKSLLINATTIGDLLLNAAQQWPDNDAIVFPNDRVSYLQLAERAQKKARALQGLGVQSGDHVGVLAPNLMETVELLFAIALSDAVAVLINARYKTNELAYVIENADIRTLITTDHIDEYVDFVDLLYQSLPGLREAETPRLLNLKTAPLLQNIIVIGKKNINRPGILSESVFDQAARSVTMEKATSCRANVMLSSPGIMMYTSGTTSDPKGCRLSHEAIVRNAREISIRLRMVEEDRQWNPLPMFHMAAIMPMLATMWAGGAYISSTHFDATSAWKLIEKEKATILYPAFPLIMSELLSHPLFKSVDLSPIRLINNVAPSDRLRENMKLMPKAVHISAYGLTESAGLSCYSHLDDNNETRASVIGQPLPGTQTRVINPETGVELGANERGEMTLKGFCLFEGYYKSPQKTAEVFDEQGWFHTGDLCSIDEQGRVSFHGRLKDTMKVGGENVSALEIESFLSTHPAIKMVQVVGVPDQKMQEVAAAYIELLPKAVCSEEEIIEYCRGKIASFKIPRYVRFVKDWPMSTTKVKKYELQAELIRELESG